MSIDEVMRVANDFGFSPLLRHVIEQHVAEEVARETERCADAARKWEDDYVMDDCAPEHVDVAIRARAEKETK